ncbi:MAG: hypothetical protein IAF00_12825 [Phycisphaerales bacterium]|nr:hypothetical protein [Phycisphaerales bacterium]
MRHLFHSIRNLTIYLVPTSLFATAGALLLALLYYPVPTAAPTTRSDNSVTVEKRQHDQADAQFAALLLDALRQLETERQQAQAQILMYRRFEVDPFFQEQPTIRLVPPSNDNTLIRL